MPRKHDIVSNGIAFGSVQVPGDGQPMIVVLPAADDHTAALWAIFRARGMGEDATTPSANTSAPPRPWTSSA